MCKWIFKRFSFSLCALYVHALNALFFVAHFYLSSTFFVCLFVSLAAHFACTNYKEHVHFKSPPSTVQLKTSGVAHGYVAIMASILAWLPPYARCNYYMSVWVCVVCTVRVHHSIFTQEDCRKLLVVFVFVIVVGELCTLHILLPSACNINNTYFNMRP